MNGTSDPTRAALYAGILAHPDEDARRLVYADYIEEHGDRARAEFIRLQCRLATMNEWDEGYTAADARCRRLLADHPEWLGPVRQLNADLPGWCGSLRRHCGHGPHSVFVRGFPGAASSSAEWFGASYADLFASFPIDTLGFAMDHAAARDALRDCPGLARLRGLGLSMWGEEREGLESLSRFRHVDRLERLEVYSESVAGDPLERLLSAPQFSGLKALTFWGDCRDNEPRRPENVVRDLDRSSWLFGLRELVADGDIFEGLGQRLARDSGWEPRLKRLGLRGYLGRYGQIPPETVAQIGQGLRSGWFAAVADLDLMMSDFEGLVLDALVASSAGRPLRLTLPARNRTGYQAGLEARPGFLCTDWAGGLRSLHIDGPGKSEVDEVLGSPLPSTLRVLELRAGTLTGGRLRALLDVPGGWPHLERLSLADNPIPDGALKEFLALCDRFPQLVSVALGNGQPAPKFLARLAESPQVARFRELRLNVPLDRATADALARSPHLSDIDLLSVIEGSAGPTLIDRLHDRFGHRLNIYPNT